MTPAASRDLPFAEVASTALSGYEGGVTVVVGANDPSRARITSLVGGASASPGRVLIAVFQGDQRTGGYGVRIDRVERDADRLIVHATFTEPPAGAIVTQVLTSPAHVVSIAAADASGARTVLLLDPSGIERARADIG